MASKSEFQYVQIKEEKNYNKAILAQILYPRIYSIHLVGSQRNLDLKIKSGRQHQIKENATRLSKETGLELFEGNSIEFEINSKKAS